MATTPVIVLMPPGRTGDMIKLYPEGGTSIANGAGGDALTETFSGSGEYEASVTEAISGNHLAVIENSAGSTYANGWIDDLQDTTERQYVTDSRPGLGEFIAKSVTAELNPSMGVLPFTVSVVDDSTGNAIEGASVRLTRSGKSGIEDTDANGDAVFSVDASIWTITVDAAGYATKSTTYTVSAAGESTEVRLSSISLPASNTAGVCTCSVFVIDQNGKEVDGAEVSTTLKDAKSAKFSGNSLVHVTGKDTTTSGGTAAVDLIQGLTYIVMVKHGKTQIKFEFTVPNATTAVLKKVTV